MRKLLILLALLPLTALAGNTPLSGVTVNPSATPGDTDKMIDETGTNSYMLTYLNDAKYVVGKISGDCSVNSSFVITCTKINGLTFPSLVANDCLASNSGATALVFTTCGSGGGGTFDAIGSGTNTTAAMVCSTGCGITVSGSGTNNANEINGTAAPTSANILGTNASKQLISQLGVGLANETYSAINAIGCAAGNEGAVYFIHDANVSSGTISSGGGTTKVLAVCDGTNWVAH